MTAFSFFRRESVSIQKKTGRAGHSGGRVDTFLASFLEERKASGGEGEKGVSFHVLSLSWLYNTFRVGSGLGDQRLVWVGWAGVWVCFLFPFFCPVSLDEERRAWVLGCVVFGLRFAGSHSFAVIRLGGARWDAVFGQRRGYGDCLERRD